MAKFNPKRLSLQKRTELLNEFYALITQLKNKSETKNFFKDLLSESETIMLCRRIQIAKQLLRGMTYDEIQEQMKVGKDTIANVHRWLQSGFGGYEKAFKKLKLDK